MCSNGPGWIRVRTPLAQPGSTADTADPPVGRAPVERLAVPADKDRPARPLPDREVEGACRAGDEGDDGGFVPLPDDAKGAVSSFDGEILDLGRAGFADPQPAEAEQYGESGVGPVEQLGREQEPTQLEAVKAPSLGGVDLGAPPRTGLGWSRSARRCARTGRSHTPWTGADRSSPAPVPAPRGHARTDLRAAGGQDV